MRLSPRAIAVNDRVAYACYRTSLRLAAITRSHRGAGASRNPAAAVRELRDSAALLAALAARAAALGRGSPAIAAYGRAVASEATATGDVAAAIRRGDRAGEVRAAAGVRVDAQQALARQRAAGLSGCGPTGAKPAGARKR